MSSVTRVKISNCKKSENVRHACEESEDACDIVAALLGEEGSEDVEKSGKSERDREDQPFIVVVVHKQGHQGADHDAHTEEVGTPQTLREVFSSAPDDGVEEALDGGVPGEGTVLDLLVAGVVLPGGQHHHCYHHPCQLGHCT